MRNINETSNNLKWNIKILSGIIQPRIATVAQLSWEYELFNSWEIFIYQEIIKQTSLSYVFNFLRLAEALFDNLSYIFYLLLHIYNLRYLISWGNIKKNVFNEANTSTCGTEVKPRSRLQQFNYCCRQTTVKTTLGSFLASWRFVSDVAESRWLFCTARNMECENRLLFWQSIERHKARPSYYMAFLNTFIFFFCTNQGHRCLKYFNKTCSH